MDKGRKNRRKRDEKRGGERRKGNLFNLAPSSQNPRFATAVQHDSVRKNVQLLEKAMLCHWQLARHLVIITTMNGSY